MPNINLLWAQVSSSEFTAIITHCKWILITSTSLVITEKSISIFTRAIESTFSIDARLTTVMRWLIALIYICKEYKMKCHTDHKS